MAIIDLNKSEGSAPSPIESCDICIVGTGPAGVTLARELAGENLRIVMLESGGFGRSEKTDLLDAIDDVGYPRVPDQWTVRNRIVGGSSHTWGGRCGPFDEIDYEKRAWIPESGWSLAKHDLNPYLDRSAAHLGLLCGTGYEDERFWDLANITKPSKTPEPSYLRPFFWQFSRDDRETYPYEYMRYGRHIDARVGQDTIIIAGATVTQLNTNETGRRIESVTYALPDGSRQNLEAKRIILCAGGIENARLLLVSNGTCTHGLGNKHDLVGRYLMDHLRGPVGSFDVLQTRALQKRLGRYNIQRHLFRAGYRLSPDIQREEHLLNCSAWLGEVIEDDDPWEAMRNLIKGQSKHFSDLLTITKNAPLLARGLKDYFIDRRGIPRKLSKLELVCMCEQMPDHESRVMLSDKRDRFGIPLPKIDWRVHNEEITTLRRMAQIISEQFPALGFPAPALYEWVYESSRLPDTFHDVAHPTGTTRMSQDPETGVVDINCMVHDVEGLYVTGTSVFPTSGHCNPTQMIVALAIRLADHLKAQQREINQLKTPQASSKRVLLTGATGRIGRIVLTDLLENGFRVRATTSIKEKIPADQTNLIEWRYRDFKQQQDFDDLVQGCDAIVHLAAELGNKHVMHRVNAETTRNLAIAGERAGIKAFTYLSTVAVYGNSRQTILTEAAPVVTTDKDVTKEFWALDYVREYGRTKLAGEHAIQDAAKSSNYTIFRPTVVVDIEDIIAFRDWEWSKRLLAAHRHSHHVYVWDVSHAIIWSLERAFTQSRAPGTVEIFNLSEDEFPDASLATFARKAYNVSGDHRFKTIKIPGIADWLRDFLRFRTIPFRKPLWMMRFPSERLYKAGYRHRYGLARAYEIAIETIRDEIKAHPS